MKTITFFNNKGGVGKTTTVYHTAWMLSEMGIRTIAVDLDPQSNLTSMFLTEDRLAAVYEEELTITISDAVTPALEGEPFQPAHIEEINEDLGLIIGNLKLSAFEDSLSDAWLKCLNQDNQSSYYFRLTSIFNTILQDAASRFGAAVVLVDVGPNLGAINRAVTIGSDFIIMPVASDLFSLQGIQNLGTTLAKWKTQWQQRKKLKPANLKFSLPESQAIPAGYVILQHSARANRPVKSYLRWADRIPQVFSTFVLEEATSSKSVEEDVNCIALMKHYRSLAPMSMEAHKPIFLLKPADGAIGAHLYAVQNSYQEFKALAEEILHRCR